MKKIIGFLILTIFSTIAYGQQKPNIVFILADDLGYGDLGSYGQKLIETPNLDKLASKGIRFTQFYAGTSVCAPSRSAFMTGQHTGHTPVRGNKEMQPEGQMPIPDSAYTMAEMFKKAGYVTGGFGKWGLGFIGTSGDPNKQGIDKFFGYNCQRQSHNFFPDHLWDNEKRIELANTPAKQSFYAADIIQEKAVSFIEENKSRPFFLYLAYTLPHAALQLPENDKAFAHYKKKFNEEAKAIPASWDGKGYQPQAYPRAAYAAMVSRLDSYVGEVMKKLQDMGIEKNTIIVFTSDNGPHREGGNQPEFFNSSGGFRGVKRALYEGGIRVPMIVSWPSVIKKPSTSSFAGASWDFFPTFAELLNQPMLPVFDGVSILPTLTGKGKQKQHEYLYWEFHEEGGRQAVRIGDWKGIRESAIATPNGPIALYNLKNDPKETKNVAAAHPDVVKRIEKILSGARVENPAFPFVKK
jgi:arylsulfatase A